MSLEDQVRIEQMSIHWHEATGLSVGMTEATGGEVSLSVQLPVDMCKPKEGEDMFYGVKCNAARAREIALSILDLADIVEKWEQDHE